MSKRKICLDAGHYGKFNRSQVVAEYYESDMNWKLHLLLKAELEKYGFEVTQTRGNKEKDLALYDRGAASKGCDLFLSLHSNAWDDPNYDYPMVIVQLDGKGDALGEQLAECVEAVMGTKQDGRIYKRKGNSGEYYGVLRGAAAVGTMGMIIEHSFHTNAAAAKWLLDESNLAKLAAAEAKVIAEHFGMAKQTESDTEAAVYRVQVGAYTNKAYAEAMLAEVKAAGFTYAFIAVEEKTAAVPEKPATATKSVDELAREVIAGMWGNGTYRKQLLTAAGYDYSAVQKRVNELLKG
jgi:N-acetylmuramoyl-L-alanine amidase